jgi:enolase
VENKPKYSKNASKTLKKAIQQAEEDPDAIDFVNNVILQVPPVVEEEPAEKVVKRRKTGQSKAETLLHLRHKLQRIFLGDSIKTEDFHKVEDLMKQVEEFQIDFDLLKVISSIAEY